MTVLFSAEDSASAARWGVAAMAAIAIHGSVVVGFILNDHSYLTSANGTPVVLIDLKAAPSATQSSQVDIAPGPEAIEAPSQLKQEKKQPDTAKNRLMPSPDAVMSTVKPEEKSQTAIAPAPETTAMPHLNESNQPSSAQLGSIPAKPDASEISWRERLVAHLQRFKRYPKRAGTDREQGTVLLNFTVDRTGHVLASTIAKGSGYPDLDQEALDLVKRAEPFPPFPFTNTQTSRAFVLPLHFYLN